MSRLRSIRDPEVQAVLSRWPSQKRFHRSPEAWEDQMMYFLLPDRFSDGNEQGYSPFGTTPQFSEVDRENAMKKSQDREAWLGAGGRFVGGTIKGVISKLGYLKRLGVSAIWIGPIFKQVAKLETYHGYGIQDFLDIDRRFGTREDLQELVKAAHEANIYVLLDVVLNHSGDVFGYKDPKVHYTGQKHELKGFWDADRNKHNMIPIGPVDEQKVPDAWNAAIWPVELQNADNFTCKGTIRDFEAFPEFLEGDFFGLKSFNLGDFDDRNTFVPSPALETLCDAFKYWLAFADIDGFRIDTVKHMGNGPTKYFASTIHSFARKVGKNNFLLVGEISGHYARETVSATGLDAALAIDSLQKALCSVPRSHSPAADYFSAFSNTPNDPKGWNRNQIVTMLDDHDQIWQPLGSKWRFCAEPEGRQLLHPALGLNLCSMGIPCIYYGTEQNFDGTSENPAPHSSNHFADQFIREAMFGGSFGAFRSHNRHFFDESSSTYRFIRDISLLRTNEVALRRGSQHLCTISAASIPHRLPGLANAASCRRAHSVVAWLRVYEGEEVLCAMNTSTDGEARAWAIMPKEGRGKSRKDVMHCLYPSLEGMEDLKVIRRRDMRPRVWLTIPPAGFVVYKSSSQKSAL